MTQNEKLNGIYARVDPENGKALLCVRGTDTVIAEVFNSEDLPASAVADILSGRLSVFGGMLDTLQKTRDWCLERSTEDTVPPVHEIYELWDRLDMVLEEAEEL